jgi:hypothetical protein
MTDWPRRRIESVGDLTICGGPFWDKNKDLSLKTK